MHTLFWFTESNPRKNTASPKICFLCVGGGGGPSSFGMQVPTAWVGGGVPLSVEMMGVFKRMVRIHSCFVLVATGCYPFHHCRLSPHASDFNNKAETAVHGSVEKDILLSTC